MSAYNAQTTIDKSIKSVLNQGYKEFEFLIADDGSTDNSKHIIDSYHDPRIKVYHNKKNIGLLNTWNKLINYASREYIIFQDADDISLEDRFSKLVNFMEYNREIAVCGANFQRTFKKFCKTIKSDYPTTHEAIMDQVSKGRVPFIRGIFRTSIVREFGKFRQFFDRVGWEDYDLFLRIAERYRVANISDVLYEYSYYNNSASKLHLECLSAKKLFIHDIGLLLHKQRLENEGIDGLHGNDLMDDITKFLEEKELFLKNNPSFAHRRKIKNQISNMDYANAIEISIKSIRIEPYVIDNYYLLVYIIAKTIKDHLLYFLK